jgi:hypothetical protein
MTAKLPPKALASPLDFMMPRIVKSLSPSIVLKGSLLPMPSWFSRAKVELTISESGCARNTSGSSITASSPLSRSYSRRLRSPVMSTPRIRRLPWPWSSISVS